MGSKVTGSTTTISLTNEIHYELEETFSEQLNKRYGLTTLKRGVMWIFTIVAMLKIFGLIGQIAFMYRLPESDMRLVTLFHMKPFDIHHIKWIAMPMAIFLLIVTAIGAFYQIKLVQFSYIARIWYAIHSRFRVKREWIKCVVYMTIWVIILDCLSLSHASVLASWKSMRIWFSQVVFNVCSFSIGALIFRRIAAIPSRILGALLWFTVLFSLFHFFGEMEHWFNILFVSLPLEKYFYKEALEQIYEVIAKTDLQSKRVRVSQSIPTSYVCSFTAESIFLNPYVDGVNNKKFSIDSIEGILAHELGHRENGDHWKQLAISALQLMVSASLPFLIMQNPFVFGQFGFKYGPYSLPVDGSPPMGALALGYTMDTALTSAWSPIELAHSRSREYNADRFALDLGYGRGLLTALREYVDARSMTVTTAWLYDWMYSTHPSLTDRCDVLQTELRARS